MDNKAKVASISLAMVMAMVSCGLSYAEGIICCKVLLRMMEAVDSNPKVDEELLASTLDRFINEEYAKIKPTGSV